MTGNIRRWTEVVLGSFLIVLATTSVAQVPQKPISTLPLPTIKVAPMQTMASYIADTQKPVTKSGMVSAGAISWQCQGSRCQSSGVSKAPNADLCRALALQVGMISSFAIGTQSLGANGLAQCNAGIATVAAKLPPAPAMTLQKTMPPPKLEGWKQSDAAKPPNPSSQKPSGGFVPKKPAGEDSKSASPTPRVYPVEVRTTSLTVTGIGRRETVTDAERRAVFRPVAVRTQSLMVTGIGRRETTEDTSRRAVFTPVAVRTQSLTVTGTGSR